MHYAYFIWSLILLGVWGLVYVFLARGKGAKKEMLKTSAWTLPFALSEPIFVPRYWVPPTLFNLAAKYHVDIESFIFCFAAGGLAAVAYDTIYREKFVHSGSTRHGPLARLHPISLLAPVIIFVPLYFLVSWNPIYPVVLALFGGGLATWICRPDLKLRMIVSGVMFLALYFVYFQTLIAVYPGYVQKVWNLKDLWGGLFLGIPVEELMFGFSFGFLWSGLYEHIKHLRGKKVHDAAAG